MPYKRSDMCNAIDDYIINSSHRQVLKLRYCEGLTYEQVGDQTGYSTQHVKHICKTYKDFLISRI